MLSQGCGFYFINKIWLFQKKIFSSKFVLTRKSIVVLVNNVIRDVFIKAIGDIVLHKCYFMVNQCIFN